MGGAFVLLIVGAAYVLFLPGLISQWRNRASLPYNERKELEQGGWGNFLGVGVLTIAGGYMVWMGLSALLSE